MSADRGALTKPTRRPKKDAKSALSEERLERIERRLAHLEARLAEDERAARERRREAIGIDVDLLERLSTRDAEHEVSGAVFYAGAVRVGERRHAWHREHAARDLLEHVDPEALAPALFALGNVARLRIVLELARGARSGAELAELADVGSTGQLYHHLRELLRAGVIVQPKRGFYEVATPALVPVLAMAAAAFDLRAP